MIKSLSEIAQVTMGQSPKSEFYNSNNNGLPFLQGRTTFGDKYPTFDTWTTSWNKEAFSGDILFTVRAPVGDLNIANCKIAIGRGLAAIHPTNVNNKYLYYLLLSNKSKFVNTSSGTIFDSINKNALESIKLNVHDSTIQNHIVNTIGSVDDLIENYNKRINKICDILSKSLEKYQDTTSISYYEPTIIKSGINSFDIEKIYLDTSSIEGVNKISSGEIITIDHRPSRANMQPIANTVWFAKMKGSNKNLIITKNDKDIINGHILSTGFMGIEASKNLPLSLLSAFVISNNFNIQRDLNSVGTTMAGINNETFKEITVPLLNNQEVEEFDKRYSKYIDELSLLRRKIKKLEKVKELLLNKYF